MSSTARPSSITASPNGEYVVATFAPHTAKQTRHVRVVVLDVFTGHLLRHSVGTSAVAYNAAPTNEVLPVFERNLTDDHDGSGDLVGLALDTGEEVWRTSAPVGCSWAFVLPASTPDASLQAARCGDSAVLFAIDDADGSVKWKYEEPVTTDGEWGMTPVVRADRAGNFVMANMGISGILPASVLLDAKSGELIHKLPSSYYPVDTGPLAVIGDGVAVPGGDALVPISGECDLVRSVTTPTSVIRVCGENTYTLVSTAIDGGQSVSVDLATKPVALVAVPGAVVLSYEDDHVYFSGYS